MQNDAIREEQKEKIINKLKAIGGTFGVLGSLGVFFVGIGTANPILTSAWLLSFPALKITNDGLKADYTSESLFGISRDKKIKLKNKDGKEEKKEIDIIQQKTFSKEPLNVMLISSDKKFKSELKRERKEFISELKNKNITKDEKKELKKEFKDNVEKKKKAYAKFKTKQISAFYSVQMLNLFNQLKEKDAHGNKITYCFNSHGVTIDALNKMNGFVENIEKYNPRMKNLIGEKMLMGNLNPIKEFGASVKQGFKNGPKAGIKKFKNKFLRKSEVHDVTFELTGEELSMDQIKEFIGEEALQTYNFDKTKTGSTILKFDKEKFKQKQEEMVASVMSVNIQQKNQIEGNFVLSREQHMTESMKQEKENQQSKSKKSSLKEELKKYRELIIAAKQAQKQQKQNMTQVQQLEEEKVFTKTL